MKWYEINGKNMIIKCMVLSKKNKQKKAEGDEKAFKRPKVE